ncbi:hypothetical protein [Luteococcus japonicus]|uniref:Uncharacterized protein n=1 Tax=Luteococcus japonicus LSP_Lj1 TaxID=1255658 RepID=A0A1R4K4Z0_9ACTN|nr:hypothetical protein [Luteococcus japonicus]SJN39387.1 hypothetical protein FM114_11505 [Luteococcus japonicus LSP_Lj1]
MRTMLSGYGLRRQPLTVTTTAQVPAKPATNSTKVLVPIAELQRLQALAAKADADDLYRRVMGDPR